MNVRLFSCVFPACVFSLITASAAPGISLWDMGDNAQGALGNGTTVKTSSPIQVISSDVTALAAGAYHSLVLMDNGSLWGTGYNSTGQLGLGNTTTMTVPAIIEASNVVSIAAGEYHSLFVKSDGSLWAMGYNEDGQLGNNTETTEIRPIEILSNGVVSVAAGGWHSFFIKTDGSLWGMGDNMDGQLGSGSRIPSFVPEKIVPSGVTTVSTGDAHTMFLKSDGSMWVMGNNQSGQLGTGYIGTLFVPGSNSPIELISSGVVSIAAGGSHSLFVKSDGSLWAMGFNSTGQLGDGTIVNSDVPVMILSSGVKKVAAGENHSMFVKTDGSLWTMGDNTLGELGIGSSAVMSTVPVQVSTQDVATVAAGYFYGMFEVSSAATVTPPAGAPAILVYDGATQVINNQPIALNLGSTVVNGAAPTLVLTVENTGTAALTVAGATVPAGFSVATAMPVQIAAGASGTITVKLTTSQAGAFAGTLVLANNTTSVPQFSVPISGVVTNIYIPPAPVNAALSLSASPASGGTVSGGGTFNAGTPSTVRATPNSGYNFTGWTLNGSVVSASASYSFNLTANESLVANFAAIPPVVVEPAPPPATPAKIISLGGNLNFGAVPINTTVKSTLIISNLGNATLTVSSIIYPGGYSGAWSGTVAAGGSHAVTVTYAPYLPVNYSGVATVNSDATSGNSVIALTANGTTTNSLLLLLIDGAGSVTPTLESQKLKAGKTYTVRAVAKPGSVFSNWTGTFNSTSNPFTFTLTSNIALVAHFSSSPFGAFAGTYNGLFSSATGPATADTAGMIQNLHVTAAGNYTGALLLAGRRAGFHGKFSDMQQSTNTIPLGVVMGGPVTLALTLSSNEFGPQVTGSVSNTSISATNLLADLATDAFPSAEYTLTLPPDTNNAPPVSSPGGTGFILIKTGRGPAHLSGSLADGTLFNQSISVSADGYMPVFAPLYAGMGLLTGWINLGTNTAGTGLTWTHPATRAGLYTTGFTNSIYTNGLALAAWNGAGNFASFTNLALLTVANATNTITNIPIKISTRGEITVSSNNVAIGRVHSDTGAFAIALAPLKGRGVILGGTNGAPGFFLTATNAQALELQ